MGTAMEVAICCAGHAWRRRLQGHANTTVEARGLLTASVLPLRLHDELGSLHIQVQILHGFARQLDLHDDLFAARRPRVFLPIQAQKAVLQRDRSASASLAKAANDEGGRGSAAAAAAAAVGSGAHVR